MDLVDRYIKQRRFGKFVQGFFEAEYERKKQEAERDREWMLWVAYVHSYSDKPFSEWKKSVIKPEGTTRRHSSDESMTEQTAQSIIDGLFKKKQE